MAAELKIEITSNGDQPQAAAVPPNEPVLPPVPPPMSQKPDLYSGQAGLPVEPITQPPRKFTIEQWQMLPVKDRDQVAREMNMAPPDEATKEETAPVSADVHDEAERRLKKMKRDKEVDQQMRAMDDEYRADAERKDDEKLKKQNDRMQRQQQKAEDAQRRNEDWLDRQERKEEKQWQQKRDRDQREQDRNEDWLARQELRDQRELQKRVQLVPEAIALHDEEEYAKRIRAAQANRERDKRMKEIRQDIDPEFAQEEADKEGRERAKLLAMGGAAIGGKIGRMMGIASQVMGNPQVMRGVSSLFGRQNTDESTDEDDKKNRKIADYDESEKEDRKQRTQPKLPQKAIEDIAKKPPTETGIKADSAKQPPETGFKAGPPKASANPPVANAGPSATPRSPLPAGGGMGEIAGAASEALPIVGAAMAVIELITDEMQEFGENRRKNVRTGIDVAKASLSMDPGQQMEMAARGFDAVADAAESLIPPLVMITPAAKELVHGFVELGSEVERATKRLGQYNGNLATQTANQEVTQIMRDIDRANRFGAQLGATDAARFNMEQKVADIADRLMPLVLKLLEGVFNFGDRWLSGFDEGLKIILKGLDQILVIYEATTPQIAQALLTGWGGLNIADLRTMIRDMLEAGNQGEATREFQRFIDGGFRVNEPGLLNINQGFGAPQPAIVPPV